MDDTSCIDAILANAFHFQVLAPLLQRLFPHRSDFTIPTTQPPKKLKTETKGTTKQVRDACHRQNNA